MEKDIPGKWKQTARWNENPNERQVYIKPKTCLTNKQTYFMMVTIIDTFQLWTKQLRWQWSTNIPRPKITNIEENRMKHSTNMNFNTVNSN